MNVDSGNCITLIRRRRMRGMASPAGKPSPKTRRMYEFDYPLNPL